MQVRLGLLRLYVREAMSYTANTSRAAPTDPDAQVPGHLPNELPPSASLEDDGWGDLDEEAWVPGHYDPSMCTAIEPDDADRLGDGQAMSAPDLDEGSYEDELDETDDRMVGDAAGNGLPDPKDPDNDGMAQHLRDDDVTSLGSPPQEKPEKSRYL